MKARIALSALAVPFVLAAAPAMASFSGTYSVTFYGGPSHTQGATQCITFTQTGTIAGFPDSGTWNSSTFGGWGGNYVHDGRTLRWYGTYGSGSGVTNFYNKIGRNGPKRGGFDEWDVSGVVAVSDGITTLISGCAPGLHQSHSTVPSKN